MFINIYVLFGWLGQKSSTDSQVPGTGPGGHHPAWSSHSYPLCADIPMAQWEVTVAGVAAAHKAAP